MGTVSDQVILLLATLLFVLCNGNSLEPDDLDCSVESVEYANSKQLSSILEELLNTTYFRMYKVNMHKRCTFCPELCSKGSQQAAAPSTPQQEPTPTTIAPPMGSHFDPFSQSEGEGKCTGPLLDFGTEKKESCSIEIEGQPNNNQEESTVDNSISKKEGERLLGTEKDYLCDEEDENSPTFWLNLCDGDEDGGEYVNLLLNPERMTGYPGSHIWKAIYEDNCFVRTGTLHELCYEERVLYRLMSGMHTSINIHIALNYYPPSKGKTTWMPNPQRFIDHYKDKPEFLKNLHFSFVVLLRSLHRASPHLANFTFNSGDAEEDRHTGMLFRRLSEAPVLKSCDEVFSAFDESLLFKEDQPDQTDPRYLYRGVTMDGRLISLKRQFKFVFRNISNILDCVTCQRCKLHAKLQLLGIGTALKILLTPEDSLKHINTWMKREEFVALINTIGRWSHAINGMKKLSEMYMTSLESMRPIIHTKIDQPKPPDTKYEIPSAPTAKELLSLADLAMNLVSGSHLSDKDEEPLISAILARDPNILLLAKHFYKYPSKFLKYALENEKIRNSGGTAALPDRDKDHVDAIIIGGGLAGLTTALNLLDRGAKVAIIEKEAYFGGNSAFASSGINAVDSDIQTDGDSVELYIRDMTKASGGPEHLEMATVLAKTSGVALKWLRNRLGLKLEQVGQLGGHSKPRTHRPTTGLAGAEMIAALNNILKKGWENQLTVLKNTRAVEILKDEQGRVKGVKYVTQDKGNAESEGSTFAPNIVLASGGFASDFTETSLLKEHTPHLLKFPTTNGRWATGDGHKFAKRDFNVDFVDMEKVQVHPTAFIDPEKPDEGRKTLCAEILRGVGGLLLDQNGNRFCNELGDRAYVFKIMNETATDLKFTILLNGESSAKANSTHIPLYTRKKLLTRYDDFSELAKRIKVDEHKLQQTFGEYNKAAYAGVDEFGKMKFNSVPYSATSAPFHAGIVTPALHYCMGGIRITPRGEVKNKHGDIIPGLYAAGEVTGGIHGETRLGGNALTECVVFGHVVGNTIEINRLEEPTNDKPSVNEVNAVEYKTVSKEELAEHNNEESCWIAINGKVYDLTDFVSEHPAGPESILNLSGKEATKEFLEVHTLPMMEAFEPIGDFLE